MSHKFKIGQDVHFTPNVFGRSGAPGTYKVIRQLPFEGDEFQYRIKAVAENFERVAKESQLARSA